MEFINEFKFLEDDILLFGREDSGLRRNYWKVWFIDNIVTEFRKCSPKGVRSLNLSVVWIAIYEANNK